MATSSQEQQFDKSEEQINTRKWFSPRFLLIITIIISALAITIVWLLSSINIIPTIWASILSAILTVLSVVITILSLITASSKSKATPTQSHISITSDSTSLQTPPLIIQFHSTPTTIQQPPAPKIPSASPTVDLTMGQRGENVLSDVNLRKQWQHNFRREDWGEIPHTGQFYGREREFDELKRWIVEDRCQVVAILGIGGIGKTSLAAQVVEKYAQEFDRIFWKSLRDAPLVEEVLKQCISFLAGRRIDLPEDIGGQIAVLREYLQNYRCLMVLDNFESVLLEEGPAGLYKGGYEGYGKLLSRLGEVRHNSCLLLTSREKPRELTRLEGLTSPVRSRLISGVEHSAAQKILADKGLTGTGEVWDKLISFYSGNPLNLKLVAEPILELFGGDIAKFLDEGEYIVSDIRDPLEMQFGRLSELERGIMYWLAIERGEVSLDDLRKDMVSFSPSSDNLALQESVSSLRKRSLIEVRGRGYYTLLPVVMEYVTMGFVERVCEEIQREEVKLLASHALMKGQAKAYIRETQERLILTPVKEKLLMNQGEEECKQHLQRILSWLREKKPQFQGYTAGNILHLLVRFGVDELGFYDFSRLVVRQAFLQGKTLQNINFSQADLEGSLFTDIFGGVLSVAFSPHGDLLAAGTVNGTIRLWNSETGAPRVILRGHEDWVGSVAFSPDGSLLASGSEDKTVRLWDPRTGEPINILKGHVGRVYSVAFSPDGSLLASGSEDKTVRLWDPRTGLLLRTLIDHSERIWTVAFSPNGSLLASGSDDGTVHLWDPRTGLLLSTIHGGEYKIRSVAFSSQEMVFAVGCDDQSIRLYDAQTGQLLKTFEETMGGVYSVTFSPDGSLLASGSDDQTVHLWDVKTGQHLRVFEGHSNWICSVAFSSDGSLLASGSHDETIRLWDARNGYCIRTLDGYSPWIYALALSPYGSLLASGSDKYTIRLWDVRTGACLRVLKGHDDVIRSVAFNSNGSLLASGSEDKTVRLWDPRTGEPINILKGHVGRVYSVAFSPDGSLLASGSEDKTVRLWDVKTGQHLRVFEGHSNWVYSVTFSPDGSLLASGSHDETIRLWILSTGQNTKTFRDGGRMVYSVAFSHDGNRLASGSDDGNVRLWDVRAAKCTLVLQGHSNRVWPVVFNPVRENILASGSDDHTVRLWNLSTGESRVLNEHSTWVTALAFSMDGSTLASGSYDGNIKLWDALSCELVKKLETTDKPYKGMVITGIRGITPAQKFILKNLGAKEAEDSL